MRANAERKAEEWCDVEITITSMYAQSSIQD